MRSVFTIFIFISVVTEAEIQFNVNTYLSAQRNEISDSYINLNNQVLKLPTYELDFDFRPDLKWIYAVNKIVLRPTFEWRYSKSEINQMSQNTTKNKLQLTDAFVETNWNPLFSSTLGLQVYQWGPAEFLSPSNPLFHFNSAQRGLSYKEKGQVLIRGNISLDQENNLVFVLQPISNQESEWKYQSDFSPKVFLKYEKSWLEKNHYIGLVSGIEETNKFFLAQYFNYFLTEGFSVYADLKQTKKQTHYTPVFDGNGYNMEQVNPESDEVKTLGIFGFRYESNFDVRLEYIYNQAGYNSNHLKSAIQSASNFLTPNYTVNLQRFLRPGLELLGQHYFYSSLRILEPFDQANFTVYGRVLVSGQDSSTQLQTEVDYGFLDSWSGFVSLSHSFGSQNTELNLLNRASAFVGIKNSF